jgi:hypothetical protein
MALGPASAGRRHGSGAMVGSSLLSKPNRWACPTVKAGTHSKIGFQAAAQAVPKSTEKT